MNRFLAYALATIAGLAFVLIAPSVAHGQEAPDTRTSSVRLERDVVPYVEDGILVHKVTERVTLCPDDEECTVSASVAFVCPELPNGNCPTAEVAIETLIGRSAAKYGLDAGWMLATAQCESTLRPDALSPQGHMGVFQFAGITWTWASVAAGHAGASPFDPVANVETAAWLWATEGPRHWTCAGKVW